MAKKKIETIKIKEAQENLINLFVNSLKDKDGNELQSKEQYQQVVNALNLSEIYGPYKGQLFLELLVRLIPSCKGRKNKPEEKWNEIKDIVKPMADLLGDCPKNKKSYKTYLNRFFDFLRDEQNLEILAKNLQGLNMNATTTAAKEAFIKGFDGEIYPCSALRTKFKSRLRCQDRTSGDKIWFPLRFIAKLYSIDKKENSKGKNSFSQWLDSLVKGICVHYFDSNTKKISHLNFTDENLSLVFKNKDEEGCYEVYIWRIKNDENEKNEEFMVFSPTGKGNQKQPMKVSSISEIDIDHVKSIDSTLREKGDSLIELKKVSDFYKEMIEEEEYDENAKAKELLQDKKKKLNLKKLKKELQEIGNDGILRLMDSKYNSQKSNGETFQKIIKNANNYYGILEEGIREKGKEDLTYTLYQDLNEQGVMRITSEKIDGEEVKDKDNLLEIIDLI